MMRASHITTASTELLKRLITTGGRRLTTKAFTGSGLEAGCPHHGAASNLFNGHIKQGAHEQAKPLESIVAHKSC